jgi:hypothetical protein
MAVKTMSVSSGTGQYNVGWHDILITKAEYGEWKSNDGKTKKYVDLWFDGYSDNMNLRMYEVVNTETNEEFKIANLLSISRGQLIKLHHLRQVQKRTIIEFIIVKILLMVLLLLQELLQLTLLLKIYHSKR